MGKKYAEFEAGIKRPVFRRGVKFGDLSICELDHLESLWVD